MTTLKEILADKLSDKEMQFLISSYDIIGDIAVIQIADELKKKERIIAEALMKVNRHIKVVAKPVSFHEGTFRLQKFKILAGEKRKETEYKENNIRLKLNIETTYFSPRSSSERKRISQLVKPGELVLVMFSGIAPFCCVIAKNTKAKEIYGVEINPDAHKYALENVKINKLSNVRLYEGDARLIVPKLKKKFDRIIMPLPKNAEDFLDAALKASKKNTVIHFYDFQSEEQFFESEDKIRLACKIAKKRCKILQIVKAGQQKPRVFRICVDFKIG